MFKAFRQIKLTAKKHTFFDSEAFFVSHDSGAAKNALAAASSHFCSAERQYRYPLEYGGQRSPASQWTVTGAGACVLSINKPDFEDNRCKSGQIFKEMDENDKKYILETSKESFKYEKTHVAKVVEGTIGRVVDLGIDDESKTIFIESTPNGMSILSLHASEDAIHVPKVQFMTRSVNSCYL